MDTKLINSLDPLSPSSSPSSSSLSLSLSLLFNMNMRSGPVDSEPSTNGNYKHENRNDGNNKKDMISNSNEDSMSIQFMGARDQQQKQQQQEEDVESHGQRRLSLGGLASSVMERSMHHVMPHWKVLLFGQFISFCLSAGGAISSTLHFECQIEAPSFQMMFCYIFMSLHLLPCCLPQSLRSFRRNMNDEQSHKKKSSPDDPFASRAPKQVEDDLDKDDLSKEEEDDDDGEACRYSALFGMIPLHVPSWEYLIIAVLVVEGNYFTYLAFGYTTFSSITLYDSLAIPTSMIASRYLLMRRYRRPHLTGTVICMIGVLLNIFVDYDQDSRLANKASKGNITTAESTLLEEYPDKALGDFLAIVGGLIYGLSSVLAEMAIKEHGNSHHEYTGIIGFYASLLSALQCILLERSHIAKFFVAYPNHDYSPNPNQTCTVSERLMLLQSFSLFMYVTYAGISYFLVTSEATLLNLSLLTADIWSVIFTIVAQNIVPPFLFWVSLALVLLGVFVYEMAPSPLTDPIKPTDFIITRIMCGASSHSHPHHHHDDHDSDGEYYDEPNGNFIHPKKEEVISFTSSNQNDPRLQIL